MIVYRITGSKYASDLTGTGAAMFGGRWNKKGTPVLYTGETMEIALLETIVHTPPLIIPKLDMLTLEIPDDSITIKEVSDLPGNWKDYPAPTILSEIAEKWIEKGETIALSVPSCILHSSKIYVLNCRHPDYYKVRLLLRENFEFDARFKK